MALLPQEIIRAKRDGKTLSKQEVDFFIDAYSEDQFTQAEIEIQRAIICGADKLAPEQQVYDRIRLSDV